MDRVEDSMGKGGGRGREREEEEDEEVGNVHKRSAGDGGNRARGGIESLEGMMVEMMMEMREIKEQLKRESVEKRKVEEWREARARERRRSNVMVRGLKVEEYEVKESVKELWKKMGLEAEEIGEMTRAGRIMVDGRGMEDREVGEGWKTCTGGVHEDVGKWGDVEMG
ncbi:hypothetical protein PV328_001012 [Microctonus aethiopoides]|uniref:Uncharacterized protein n=1 Tax=Microctonus aethiopoides TaxID=144406 RepID=A0AA39FXA0_9HYME|nr:hypothetical protein PV328_001012 [Microctonus aethiopoides]